jgi:hypothetical protein
MAMINQFFQNDYSVDESVGPHGAPEEGVVFLAQNELRIQSVVFDEYEFYPSTGASWIGRFQRALDNHDPKAVYSTPVPTMAFIVAGQQGYVVDVPKQTSTTLQSPVIQVAACNSPSVLIVADYSTLTLMSTHGEVWRSPHLVSDALSIVGVEADRITIEGFVSAFGDIRRSVFRIKTDPLDVSFLCWVA